LRANPFVIIMNSFPWEQIYGISGYVILIGYKK